MENSGLNSPPSPISVFKRRIDSELDLGRSEHAVRETLTIVEDFELTSGQRHRCASQAGLEVQAQFGRKGSEAAVQLGRGALSLARQCEPAGFPEATLEIPETIARFVLRGDRLIAYAPKLERREYLPVQ
jgi:hypothetical protein